MGSKEINFGYIDVNEVNFGSTIGLGRNLQINVKAKLNVNQGFGIETSDGSHYNSQLNKVWDSDMFDFNHVYRGG